MTTGKENGVSLKRMGQQFLSGGSAGLVEICLMHPLDVVKTRFQLQGGANDPMRYNSVAHCFRTMYRTEGFLSFYKGILPPILAETPKRAVKFFCFERYQDIFSGGGQRTPWVYAAAGLCSGLTEGIVINPFERVKVQLQSERNVRLSQQESTFSKARAIIKRDGYGMRGINRGLTATLGRHGVWNMVYFGFYHSVKTHIPKYEYCHETLMEKWKQARIPDYPWLITLKCVSMMSKMKEFACKLVVGFTAGSLASTINIPYDVAKSRIQGPQPVPGQIKYYYAHRTMLLIFREEGPKALFKGLVPKLMRLGPSGAIMMLVYDYFSTYLAKRFP